MTTNLPQNALPRRIASRLTRLRFYIRLYVLLQGIALVLAATAAAFWITLALDWLFEPSPAVRVGIWILALGAIGWILCRYVLLRLLVPLRDASLALLLERRFPRLGDRLLTVVDFSADEGFDPLMLEHTRNEAESLADQVRPGQVFRLRPLITATLLALVMLASVAVLGWAFPTTVRIWTERVVMLGHDRWPRDTKIVVDGFPLDDEGRRVAKVAIGGDLEVHARADTSLRIPDSLEVRYLSPDGALLRQGMTMQGTAVPGRDPFQNYVFKFQNVQTTIRFDVISGRSGLLGKDDRVENLWIEAVEAPALTNVELSCKFPPYLHREDDVLPVTGIVPLPEGTDITLLATANKPLVQVEAQVSAGSQSLQTHTIDVSGGSKSFELKLGPLQRDTIVLLTLHDTDQVSNRDPIPLHLRVVPDQLPEIDVRLAGIGKAVTPRARLPLEGNVKDDHGLARAWFEFRTANSEESTEQDFTVPKDGALKSPSGVALDLEPFAMKPGERLFLWVKAADEYPLSEQPHVSSTSRYELEIVTESQLRSLLETSELLLRQRVEGVIRELERTRDSLARLKDRDAEDADEELRKRHAARHSSRIEEAAQSRRRTENEILEVAEQIEGILEELSNNRVEHLDQSRSRLVDGVADPLRRIVAEQYPRLQAELETLRSSVGDDDARVAAAEAAQQQVQAILSQLDQVVSKMLELESFNELLAQLRNIIRSHENVSRMTEQRREQLRRDLRRRLLEDDTESNQ